MNAQLPQTNVKNSLTKSDNALGVIQKNLKTLLTAKQEALPKNFNQTRFLQNCMTVLLDVKEIEKMSPTSVARTMLKGAFLGLDFFRKECYAIPYGSELQFQTDYKGDKKIAKLHSIRPIKEIFAKLVRDGDFYEEAVIDGKQAINFRPVPFSEKSIKGAFAVVLYEDGEIEFESMTKKEIEEIRDNYSKAKNSANSPWTKTPGEMYKKTVLRRLCKNIEIDFDGDEEASREKQKAFEDGSGMDFDKKDPAIFEAETVEQEEQIIEVNQNDDEKPSPFGKKTGVE